MTQLAYQSTSPEGIALALSELNQGPVPNDGMKVTRSAHSNFIIVLPSAEYFALNQSLLEKISTLRPGRIFVLCLDDAIDSIECQVALHCHLFSGASHVCSEIIRLSSNRRQLKALNSLVRAHVYAGVSAELLIVASQSRTEPAELVSSLEGLADSFYFDSRKFSVEALARLLSLKGALVDMSWLSTTAWRAQLKELFDRPALLKILAQAREIEVYQGSSEGISPGHLLCSWLRRCVIQQNLSIAVSLVEVEVPAVQQIIIRCKDGQSLVKLQRVDQTIQCEAQHGVQLSRPIDPQDNVELLERYFLIGESLLNYRPALCGALESCCA